MAQLKYYYDLMSQPSRAVYIFLKANKIPFQDKPVALRKGEHFSEDFKKLNPMSKVPFVDDNGFILTESVAILKYLCSKYKVKDHWYPQSDVKKVARVDEYLNWQHTNTRLNAALVFQHLLILPKMTGKGVNENQLNKFKKGVKETVSSLDRYYLNGKPYLCGDDISIADILGACELMQLRAVHEEHLYTENPTVLAWMGRVREKLNPEFDSAHKFIERTRDVYPHIKANL
ncbi:hypothetical protein LOTGIDRAFT_207042 [Lottia gigantea]|uniref:Glutathione transferase n=1 Tax=Lottia gigantea TaxID=225164 RepID=V3ZWL3_LOTGI|nr:hypothetical protein LOTGIDRAFT_207042 [Lottia gigantea]ESO86995.1 hypothetical protein LOTGIDRAFT_207042 [Lottia gigantea]